MSGRVWMIDPIDGTDNYIIGDGQYCVMIGLLVDRAPVFGWVFQPDTSTLYFGGPGYGAWKQHALNPASRFDHLSSISQESSARVIMGYRDRTAHPWVKEHPKVVLVKAGSIGLKVAKVLEREADIFVHLSGKLKTWDTAGPAAIALGGGLDVGTLDSDVLSFPLLPEIRHGTSVIIGCPGSLAWSRTHLRPPGDGKL